jgi:hypothetical protein
MAEADAAARKLLSNRAHQMREALVAARARVRQAGEQSRRHRLEVGRVAGVARCTPNAGGHMLCVLWQRFCP